MFRANVHRPINFFLRLFSVNKRVTLFFSFLLLLNIDYFTKFIKKQRNLVYGSSENI